MRRCHLCVPSGEQLLNVVIGEVQLIAESVVFVMVPVFFGPRIKGEFMYGRQWRYAVFEQDMPLHVSGVQRM